jgi:hypothetical protein
MKYHKLYPLPPRDGRYREALIEFKVNELRGLMEVIQATLDDPELDKNGNAFISFENRAITDDPAINCWFDKVKE